MVFAFMDKLKTLLLHDSGCHYIVVVSFCQNYTSSEEAKHTLIISLPRSLSLFSIQCAVLALRFNRTILTKHSVNTGSALVRRFMHNTIVQPQSKHKSFFLLPIIKSNHDSQRSDKKRHDAMISNKNEVTGPRVGKWRRN